MLKRVGGKELSKGEDLREKSIHIDLEEFRLK